MLSDRKELGNSIILGNSWGKPQTRSGDLWKGSSKKVICPKAQLECLYAKAGSLGNEQGELETVVHLENYDFIAITETWWDDVRNWNTTIEGYNLFGRVKQEIALYVKKYIGCEELPLRNNQKQAESMWVKIRNGTNN